MCDTEQSKPSDVEGFRILNAGLHFIMPTWTRFGLGPWYSLGFMPAPGCQIEIDPPSCRVQSSDAVQAKIDVKFIGVVLDWGMRDVLGNSTQFMDVAKTICNQWIARQVASLKGEQLMSYANVTALLNDGDARAQLNRDLAGAAKLRCTLVQLEAKGLTLDTKFTDQMRAQTELNAKRRTQDLEAQVELAKVDQRVKQSMKELEVERSRRTMESEAWTQKLKAMIDLGLEPSTAAQVFTSFTSVTALEKAQRVYVGISPSQVGLQEFVESQPKQ
jgi:hypothetical protein